MDEKSTMAPVRDESDDDGGDSSPTHIALATWQKRLADITKETDRDLGELLREFLDLESTNRPLAQDFLRSFLQDFLETTDEMIIPYTDISSHDAHEFAEAIKRAHQDDPETGPHEDKSQVQIAADTGREHPGVTMLQFEEQDQFIRIFRNSEAAKSLLPQPELETMKIEGRDGQSQGTTVAHGDYEVHPAISQQPHNDVETEDGGNEQQHIGTCSCCESHEPVKATPHHNEPECDGESQAPTDADESGSEASTDRYEGQETYVTYQDKVLQLCRKLWPTYSDDSFLIEKLKGGDSNRVVRVCVANTEGRRPSVTANNPSDSENGLDLQVDLIEEKTALGYTSIHGSSDKEPKTTPKEAEGAEEKAQMLSIPPGDYVFRISRFHCKDYTPGTGVLNFVRSQISFDVPTVVHFDASNGGNNLLDRPYSLQTCISGKRLDAVWDDLNHTQRLLITLDMARLCKQLMRITNTSGGIPDLEQGLAADGTCPTVDYYYAFDEDKPKRVLSPQLPVDMLCERLKKWTIDYDLFPDVEAYHGAPEMLRHMQSTNRTFGEEGDGPLYYLNHGDLYPRNIMVEVTSPNTAHISGIIDWDDAFFAPAVISFLPPAWLWLQGYWGKDSDEGFMDDEDLWKVASIEPHDQDQREIKACFDAVVGPQYLQYAYSPDAYTARKIWRAAYDTHGKSWVFEAMMNLYKDWAKSQGKEVKLLPSSQESLVRESPPQ